MDIDAKRALETINFERDSAKRSIARYSKQIRDSLDRVDAAVKANDSLNELGELQALTGHYEASVGAYGRLTDILNALKWKKS